MYRTSLLLSGILAQFIPQGGTLLYVPIQYSAKYKQPQRHPELVSGSHGKTSKKYPGDADPPWADNMTHTVLLLHLPLSSRRFHFKTFNIITVLQCNINCFSVNATKCDVAAFFSSQSNFF